MASLTDLRVILNQLQTSDTKNFSELDNVFESIVNENSNDLLPSMDLLEEFFRDELQKTMTKEM